MPRPHVITAALLAATATATLTTQAAADAPLRIGDARTPVTTAARTLPTVTNPIDRWVDCHVAAASAEPLVRFQLDRPTALRIRIDARPDTAAVLVFPDGGHACDEDHRFISDRFAPGTYAIYLYGASFQVTGRAQFEDYTASRAGLATALRQLPALTLGDDAAPNPAAADLPAAIAVDVADAGRTCGKAGERIAPVARLRVTRAATWTVQAAAAATLVVAVGDACLDPRGGTALPLGEHVLWARLADGQAPPPRWALTVDDTGAPLRLPPAPPRTLDALDAPLVIAGQTQAPAPWLVTRGHGARFAATPDAYLRTTQPLTDVHLGLTWAPTAQALCAYGPLETADARTRLDCWDRGRDLSVMDGTYAVWVASAAAGADFHLVVTRRGLTVDPLTTLAPIPATLDVDDRAVRNHYPYFDVYAATAWARLDAAAPDQLFVYARAALPAGDATVPAGEPLFVLDAGGDTVSVARYDGTSLPAPRALITAERPAAVTLPTAPLGAPRRSIDAYRDDRDPAIAKAVTAYLALAHRFDDCFGSYMAKHDPTWGHDQQVYVVRGGRVENVGDRVAAAGERACGLAKRDRGQAKLMDAIVAAELRRRQATLTALRARFGLR